jgi:hypothetical protein
MYSGKIAVPPGGGGIVNKTFHASSEALKQNSVEENRHAVYLSFALCNTHFGVKRDNIQRTDFLYNLSKRQDLK